MTRKPFPHRPERATDLLGIIHTDVCGPFRHVSRQGASYFITFTDDYSRYGYVYLFKHKHEVFEMFKVFKNNVENQLGKTIKALRSDRGGEYISQEFKDYLKACGIGCEAFVKHDMPDKLQQRSVKFNGGVELEEIQDEDTSPSENTSEIPLEVEGFKPPQEEVILVCRSARTHRAPERLCLYVKVEEHSLGDLNEPTNYKAAMLDRESNKVDYEETFSPVADIRAIRILIAIAAFYDYEIWQMDVKTAFLNGYLDEDIYMVQPEGFVDPKHPRKVCKLQRSIYDLKQETRSWNKRFDEEIIKFGFAQNLDESCVYQKASTSNVTFLILYVDEIIIMENYIPSLQSVKSYLGMGFAMKDLGEAVFILRIKIYQDRTKRLIGLSQSAYMDKILKRFKMDNSKRGNITMQERFDLNKTQGASTTREVKRMQNVPYASVVGSIMYTVRCTRPDVAFVQNIASCFQQNPGEPYWTVVKPILNSKHSTTAMSATKAEYLHASEAGMESVWIRKFILWLGIVPTINEPIKMFCDNSAALLIANEPGVQRGAKHYHRRYHYVRESIELGEIKFLKVHTVNNLAYPFMKALPKGKLTQHARSMGLRLASSFM
ncbi:retrotransposon protein, putative, ty1-copia subclass [Tanacetum coccineum]